MFPMPLKSMVIKLTTSIYNKYSSLMVYYNVLLVEQSLYQVFGKGNMFLKQKLVITKEAIN